MELFNFNEWILKRFKLRVSEKLKNIFFQFDSSIPPCIYDFDTYQPWEYFYKHVIQKFILNGQETKCNFFVDQFLWSYQVWEKLYYLLGKNFFFFFFLECRIYFKWGKNTYILLSNTNEKTFTKRTAPSFYNYVSHLPVFEEGYDRNVVINMYQILYSTVKPKKSLKMIPEKDTALLKHDILSQCVGPEISRTNPLGIKQVKCLNTLINNNPTIKQCKLILDEIVNKKDNIVSVQNVILLLSKIIERYIPYKLLFQRIFLAKFIKNMRQFMEFNINQKLTLGFVMKGIAKKQDPMKRNIIAKIIMWIINILLFNIIRSLFYVSIGDKGNGLIFIKLEFWITKSKMFIREMITNNQILEVNDHIKVQHMKNIKFLPKFSGSGYRPLITNSKSDKLNKYKLELCNIFLKQLIAFKKGSFPNPSKELHAAWLNYMKKKSRHKNCYFVKTDIKDAYGSIIHHKLKTILKEWFGGIENNLILMSFDYKGKWGKTETLKQFVNLTPSAGEKILKCKAGSEEIIQLSELKSQIFYYIDNIYITFSHKKYRIVRGVPQGGKISAALCEIYYTSLDHNYLSQLHDFNNGDILLRAVDDYIFISQDPRKINEFLDIMSSEIPEYGMEIQSEKTVTNYKFDENLFFSNSDISFFGFNLDVKHGYITPDLNNYQDINIKSTISFNKLNKRVLLQKMTSIIALKLHPLLFDNTYQSIRILLQNIHCASCVMAIKFVAIVQLLKIADLMLEEEYLMFCINKSTSAIASYVYRKGRKAIEYKAAKKIGLKSFILILGRKDYYFKLVERLQLKASQFNVKSKRVDKLIKAVGKKLPPSLSYSQ